MASAEGELTGAVQSDQIPPANPGRPAPAKASEPDHGLRGWVGIVANRNSGIGRGLRSVHRLVAALRRVGLSAEIAWTPEARAALVSQSAADPRCRCLVAVGGDGTVSALINEGPIVPLTVFPAGTENLVAQHFGLGRDPKVLAGLIAAGRPVRVDLARAAERRFLLMAGFGFDGDIVTRHHQARRFPLGFDPADQPSGLYPADLAIESVLTGSRASPCGSPTPAPKRS